ncbi:L,D-transpeptidase [Clostridium sp. SHJSY1]|uniref:L,D-transpeptidase n=1 Tax=Clostridium sp. SHJSY1 TaxID=2942483 RepID=UPI002875D298|nr:L,D-transpeptidase [Clostridium sp. SHJSY1]MDS0528138.1 L,D-transpeptidase [Clostridium sp. SHJSY1]
MKKNNFYWAKSANKHNIPKLKILFTLLIIILTTTTIFEYKKYKSLITEFSSNFEENDFSNANNILLTKETLNPFKSLYLQKDLEKYFEGKLNTISNEIESGNINEQSGLDLIQEISRYDIPVNNSEGIINNCSNTYNAGVNFFDSGKYIYAYNVFSNIKYTDENYASAVEYIRKCKDQIISDTILKSTNLANSKNYDKALSLLDSVSSIVGDDESIVSKIEELKTYQACSISNDATTQATTAKPTNITMSNINQLSLDSTTSYLVQVDLNNQKTNIYKGKKNSWNLIKSFSCSTGTNGEETPKGTYTIKEKGAWFFSNSYKQGGKYWVQFYGNYLFHSLPYNEDKSKIVDFTLGKPASHGCVRLGESDSKWIYDNIPRGSKVIVQ